MVDQADKHGDQIERVEQQIQREVWSEQADRYADLWQRYKDGVQLSNDEIHEFTDLLVEQADRREAGTVTPSELSRKTRDDERPASPSAYPRKLAEALCGKYYSPDQLAAVLASEGVVDPEVYRVMEAEAKRHWKAANDSAAKVERLKRALRDIAKGDGAFSTDRLTHAQNCLENMKKTASDVLAPL